LIGPPGSGKTTLLRHIALALAHPQVRRTPRKLPILLFIRTHARAIASNDHLPLSQVIQSGDIVREMNVSCPAGWFDRQLGRGRCLVLLDGLDEVADREVRHKVIEWVERQMRTYPKNLFLVTSRPHGYRDN